MTRLRFRGFWRRLLITFPPRTRSALSAGCLLQKRPCSARKEAVPALLGMMNLALHGVPAPKLRRRNTLAEPMKTTPAERFDVVLTNLPFGGTENEAVQDNFPVRSNATELLFIEHIMKKLKSGAGKRCARWCPKARCLARSLCPGESRICWHSSTCIGGQPAAGFLCPVGRRKDRAVILERRGHPRSVVLQLPIRRVEDIHKGSPLGTNILRNCARSGNLEPVRQPGGRGPFVLRRAARAVACAPIWEAYARNNPASLGVYLSERTCRNTHHT